MTKDEILAMEPGRELDVLVTEKVMEWKERVDFDYVDGLIARYVPGTMEVVNFQPSTDISAAWEAAEKFETIEIKRFVTDKGLWFCEIKEKIWHRSYGNTAHEAICKAALLATLEEKA